MINALYIHTSISFCEKYRKRLPPLVIARKYHVAIFKLMSLFSIYFQLISFLTMVYVALNLMYVIGIKSLILVEL